MCNLKEMDLHGYSAVWTFSEFSFLHAVLCYSCNSVRIFDADINTWYRRSDIFYAFIVALFVLFWVLQLNTTAKVFEWGAPNCTVDVFVCYRAATQDERFVPREL